MLMPSPYAIIWLTVEIVTVPTPLLAPASFWEISTLRTYGNRVLKLDGLTIPALLPSPRLTLPFRDALWLSYGTGLNSLSLSLHIMQLPLTRVHE